MSKLAGKAEGRPKTVEEAFSVGGISSKTGEQKGEQMGLIF